MIKVLANRSTQIVIILTIYVLVADSIPTQIQKLLYTISLQIKEILIWIMPITICAFISNTVRKFEKQALIFILSLLFFESTSNFCAVWYAYFSAGITSSFMPPVSTASEFSTAFTSLWQTSYPRPWWWSADKGAFVGVLLGCLGAFYQRKSLASFINYSHEIMEWLLVRVFARLIPLFILGFAVHIYQTKLLDHVISHYASLIFWLGIFLLIYILVLFILSAGISMPNIITHIKNLHPAGMVALTSGCSLSTMPWTIDGASKNLQNPSLAKVIIPATTNIQQIGDCIVNSFLCYLIYTDFFDHTPDMYTWTKFTIVFVLARFLTAAVIGGSIFIMLPIYETYLGFNNEMIAIILALNVVLDPIVTSSNVMANGALCRVFERFWNWLQVVLYGEKSEAIDETN